jgi:hypothetical protein
MARQGIDEKLSGVLNWDYRGLWGFTGFFRGLNRDIQDDMRIFGMVWGYPGNLVFDPGHPDSSPAHPDNPHNPSSKTIESGFSG